MRKLVHNGKVLSDSEVTLSAQSVITPEGTKHTLIARFESTRPSNGAWLLLEDARRFDLALVEPGSPNPLVLQFVRQS
jgi:hypothetical protein